MPHLPLSFLDGRITSVCAGLFTGCGREGCTQFSASSLFLLTRTILSRCFLLFICTFHTASLRTTDSHKMHNSCPLSSYVRNKLSVCICVYIYIYMYINEQTIIIQSSKWPPEKTPQIIHMIIHKWKIVPNKCIFLSQQTIILKCTSKSHTHLTN